MSKIFNVGADIDDVLFGWYLQAHLACVAYGLVSANAPMPTTWHPFQEYPGEVTRERWLEAIDAVTLTGELYMHPPEEHAVRAIRQLAFDGHKIHLITARGFLNHADLIKGHTQDWLVEYGVPNDSLTFAKNKVIPAQRYELDFFIDDNLDNYDALDLVGINVYLLNQPWNQVAEGPTDRRRRVDSVQQYVDIITEAAQHD